MAKGPREQAHSYARKLTPGSRTRQPVRPLRHPDHLPDTAFDRPASQDDLRDLVLGEQDLPGWERRSPPSLTKAFPPDYLVPECNWVALLHQLWGETWIPRVRLGHRATMHARNAIALTSKQLELIDNLAGNQRLLVEVSPVQARPCGPRGGAAHGGEGKRVRLLCFTDALAKWLAVLAFRQRCAGRYRAALRGEPADRQGADCFPAGRSATWAEISYRAAAEAPPDGDERP